MTNEKECKHQYETRVVKKQEVFSKYLSDSKYLNQVLEQEVLIIFCSKCSDTKTLDVTIEIKPKDD